MKIISTCLCHSVSLDSQYRTYEQERVKNILVLIFYNAPICLIVNRENRNLPFKSLWTIPLLWITWTPSTTCWMTSTQGTDPSRRLWWRACHMLDFPQYWVTKQNGGGPVTHTPINRGKFGEAFRDKIVLASSKTAFRSDCTDFFLGFVPPSQLLESLCK